MDTFHQRWLIRVISLALCCPFTQMALPDSCHGNETYVDCHGGDITEMPEIKAPITYLDLSSNKIRNIESLKYTELLYLNVSQNQISHIHINAFHDLTNLVTLDLSSNSLSGVNFTKATFEGLRKLENLYLQNNPIKTIEQKSLNYFYLENLKILNLSYCEIFKLSGLASSDLMEIKSLCLRGNRLTETDLDMFDGLSSLESLDLSSNPIKRIKDRPFNHLLHLTHLHLENCQLRSLGENAFDGLDDLLVLSLRNNTLTDISFEVFRPLDKLQELVLSGNPIKVFDASFFPVVSKFSWELKSLRLDDMPDLKTIGPNAFAGLYKLRMLSIQNNGKLSDLEDFAFHFPYPQRYKISILLANNSLTSLTRKTLDWDKVESVDLSGNPWYCDCKLRWVFHVEDVTNKTGPITCRGPIEYKGADLFSLSPEELGCINRATKIAMGVLLLVCMCIALGISVFFIIRWRRKSRYTMKDILCCACIRKKDERYVSVYQNDDLEPFARITFSDDDDTSRKAVDL